MRKLVIAIDGPVAAGKSTVARRLARELGYIYLDTGAMYRAVAWKLKTAGVEPDDEKELRRVLGEIKIELKDTDGDLRVFLDGAEITEEIRTPEISQRASLVSTFRAVRERMVELQRAIGRDGGVVAEGRDIGTVVFPQADVKIYLDASPGERARRRFAELKSKGHEIPLEQTLREMEERDRRDRERELAPLSKAQDAIVIDSTGLGVDRVVERIMQEIKRKMAANP